MKNRLFLFMVAVMLCLYSVSSVRAIIWTTLDYPGVIRTELMAIEGQNVGKSSKGKKHMELGKLFSFYK